MVQKFCGCMKVRKFKDAVADLSEEAGEIFSVKSWDEFRNEASDVSWAFGRLFAGMVGKVYVRMPGDRQHYRKVMKRMEEQGCVRSSRHLVEGRCPSVE
jgi:hypothetical protein